MESYTLIKQRSKIAKGLATASSLSMKTERIRPPIRKTPRSPRNNDLRRFHQGIAVEITLKLGVNLLLCVAAITALSKLFPYQQVQQAKLAEVRRAVQEAETRVYKLRGQLNHNFDPEQTKQLMQEQSYRVDPNQRRIFWMTQGQ